MVYQLAPTDPGRLRVVSHPKPQDHLHYRLCRYDLLTCLYSVSQSSLNVLPSFHLLHCLCRTIPGILMPNGVGALIFSHDNDLLY